MRTKGPVPVHPFVTGLPVTIVFVQIMSAFSKLFTSIMAEIKW